MDQSTEQLETMHFGSTRLSTLCRRRDRRDARDNVAFCNLAEQARQHWRVARRVVHDFDSSAFHWGRKDTKIDRVSLPTVVRAGRLRLPYAVTEHLAANVIDQLVQACRRWACLHRDRHMFLALANGTEVSHLPVKAGQLR